MCVCLSVAFISFQCLLSVVSSCRNGQDRTQAHTTTHHGPWTPSFDHHHSNHERACVGLVTRAAWKMDAPFGMDWTIVLALVLAALILLNVLKEWLLRPKNLPPVYREFPYIPWLGSVYQFATGPRDFLLRAQKKVKRLIARSNAFHPQNMRVSTPATSHLSLAAWRGVHRQSLWDTHDLSYEL